MQKNDFFSCADPESFVRGTPTLTTFFFFFIAGHHWPASETPLKLKMAFRLRADDGSTLNAGLVALPFSRDPDQYYLETLFL